ncbi:methyltransferase [Balneolaceae bacterium YR4-1]|uniref:Methyltransferase n=1 Tax=Halalkalibaculum roseum TaxID=2709311 RepID=A0A6M1SXE5_9BACT|nr:methyltransferase domain-containing protein [Halalkalibaculum roseum]NGP77730.1 methyltransferase [Halalkalibaculum roseum]
MSTLAYLRSFFMDKDVASVTPTSRFCVRTVCKPIDFSKDLNIVEYGAGTGVFSKYLLKHMSLDSQLYLFETNDILYKKLLEIKNQRVHFYRKSVEHVTEILGEELLGKVDYIISGIPFSFLDEAQKESILNQSKQILKEGGGFLAYQTSGHLKDPLEKTFGNVETEWEWRNIPPMTVYRAFK